MPLVCFMTKIIIRKWMRVFSKFPPEGWGVSNDTKENFGPPKFEDRLFTIEENKAISITMQ